MPTRIGRRSLAAALRVGGRASLSRRPLQAKLPPAASFSSSSSPRDEPESQSQELLRGFDEVAQTFRRCRERKHEFERYTAEKAFQPSPLALLNNWLLFYHLNRPQRVYRDLDLHEFLAGAKHALEGTMLAMYSREFANFATGAIDKSEAAEHLHAVLEPVSLDALKHFIKHTEGSGIRTELQRLTIHAAYLVGAQYDRVPRRPTRNSAGAEVVGLPEDERLRLQVCFELTEHVNVKLPSDPEPELVEKRNVAIWQFESIVTTLEDLEWRLEPLNMVSG